MVNCVDEDVVDDELLLQGWWHLPKVSHFYFDRR